MPAQLKTALVTTAMVLAVIYVARMIPVSRDLVNKALAG